MSSNVIEIPTVAAGLPAAPARSEPATKPRSALWRKLRKGAWVIGDQAMISATNFATMVMIAWGLSKEDFGAFTLVYALLLQANAMQGSLITQPHNVLGVTRSGKDYARYTTSSAATNLAVALAAGTLAVVAAGVTHLLGWTVGPLLLALAPAIVAWQLQEFVRRVLYTERRFADAFANDLIGYGGYAATVAALFYAGALTAPRALYALALTSLVAAIVGAWRLRRSLAWSFNWTDVRENWDFGKWLAGGSMLRWFSSAQMFQYLAAFVLGMAATATLKSAQILFGPSRMLATSLTAVLPSRFARTQAASGKAGLHAQMKSTYFLVAPVLGAYCLLVALFAGPLLRLVYPDGKYAGGETVLRLYAVSSFLSYNLHFASSALRAGRLTRDVFKISIWTAIIAVVSGWLCIRAFGVSGALMGMIIASLMNNVLYWLAYRRHLNRKDEPADESANDLENNDDGAAAIPATAAKVIAV